MQECMTEMGFPPISRESLPLSSDLILTYISYLHLTGKAPSTITTYVAAIGFVHKFNSLSDPTNLYIVQRSLATINKRFGRPDSRLPITRIILHQLIDSLDNTSKVTYHQTLIKAMYATAFYGLFRIGEITIQKSGDISLHRSDISILPDRLIIKITKFKTNITNQPFDIVIHKQEGSHHCPYYLLINYLNLRGDAEGPLFCFPDNKPIPRTFFNTKLHHSLTFCGLNPKLYLSHSFRIGSASYLASIGCNDLQIKIMGRWKSDSFLRYIRNQKFSIGG